jgi:transmembrane sensor
MSVPNHQGRPSGDGDHRVEREARAWVVRLTSGTATQDDARALADWRANPEHDAAFRAAAELWRAAGHALAALGDASATRAGMRGMTRRRMLGRVAVGGAASASIAAAGATLALRWPALNAAHRTGTGEIRTLAFASGIRIELDAETTLDADPDPEGPAIALHAGAVVVTVPTGHAALSLSVGGVHLATQAGQATEFAVRCRLSDGLSGWVGGTDADLSCLSGFITVVPTLGRAATRLTAGQAMTTGSNARGVHPVDIASVAAWRRGLLVFRDTPLSQVVEDLNRYRPGRIILGSSSAASRRVTGIFHLERPEEALGSIRTALALSEVRLGDRIVVLR